MSEAYYSLRRGSSDETADIPPYAVDENLDAVLAGSTGGWTAPWGGAFITRYYDAASKSWTPFPIDLDEYGGAEPPAPDEGVVSVL